MWEKIHRPLECSKWVRDSKTNKACSEQGMLIMQSISLKSPTLNELNINKNHPGSGIPSFSTLESSKMGKVGTSWTKFPL